MTYRVVVKLEAESQAAANRIMAERLGYDEELGVGDYSFTDWDVDEWPPGWNVYTGEV